MPLNHENAKECIYAFLIETANIFIQVKKYSILIEEKLPEHKAPVHAANELKSLVFHLYNTATLPEHASVNLVEAKEHLCRAFYDLHSIAIAIYIEEIKRKINDFKTTTIAVVFPEYGSTIRPAIRNIQEELREIRTSRNTDIVQLNSDIDMLAAQVKAMQRFDDICESMKPLLVKYEKEKDEEEIRKEQKEKRKNVRDKVWDIFKIIVAAIAGALITLLITR